MTAQTGTYNVGNYLVPAAGQTHCAKIQDAFTATPELIDWRNFSVDNFPFSPQGVFVDNSQNTGTLTITILPLNYVVSVPAGAQIQAQFPAPNGQTCTIASTGNGKATCYFVDFPVLPNGSQVSLSGVADVNIASASNAASPVYVSVPASDGGLPYQSQNIPQNSNYEFVSVAAGSTTANVAPPANSNLRRAKLTISANATLAAAATDLITVTLNGVTIFQVSPYIPTAVGNSEGSLAQYDLDFSDVAPNTGAAGTLVVTLTTALATGVVELSAYFD